MNELMDLTAVKRGMSPVPPPEPLQPIIPELVHRATQTELLPTPLALQVSVKQEPVDPPPLKLEQDTAHSPPEDAPDLHDDDSDNMSLISLKKKKRKKKHKKDKAEGANGDFKGKKRKRKLKDWEMLMSALPQGTALGMVEGAGVTLKQESDCEGLQELQALAARPPAPAHHYTCCVCLNKFYSQAAMLDHYM